ncbi:ABC transporter ATP-binding protein [Clostridium sp. 'deep sea']|uniref:ABC transporter ATP-binding protein n=1 Tax=Clostridium sp. 'deep sea' TaxID=2779445 RepID=UPI0018969969|nr:ABC transporter ATP-binding protein [Clostridium sp. 'deep sea']QOR35871.1 ABC transporter ATP-binding protein [Clostridium sp. 'deep sea']
MKILEIHNVTKKYSRNKPCILNNVNLTLKDGEFVAIMGPSGSGKTTLLNIASGIDKCNSGDVYLLNNNICKMKKNELSLLRRRNIGMVFQDFNLLSSLTLKENILVPLILDKKIDIIESNKVEELANLLGITDILNSYPYEISGGQQQRAAICRAIINTPKILFADEPTGNLDSKSSMNVMSSFDLVRKDSNASILMVTHDAYTASYSDRVVFFKDGLTVQQIVKQKNSSNFYNEIIDIIQNINN